MAITGENALSLAISGALPPILFAKLTSPILSAGKPLSLWYITGIPGEGVAPASGISGAALTSAVGQIPFGNPSSGKFAYLARFWGQSTLQGVLLLCDRLWENSGLSITSTTPQTVASVQFPARDNNGSTNGEGVLIGVEVSSPTGANAPVFSMSYTNSEGTSGRTANNAITTISSAPIGSFFPMGLQGGDKGVRSIQTFTLSASWTSGAIHLVAYRVLAEVVISSPTAPAKSDIFDVMLQRLYDNTVPFLIFIPTSSASASIVGGVTYTHG